MTIVRLTVPPTIVQQGTVPVSIKQELKMVERSCEVRCPYIVPALLSLVDTGDYQLEID